MEDLLLPDQRQPPMCYAVNVQGKRERTVSVRGGISWPEAGTPGYLIMVAQLEKKDRNGNLRFLAFAEDSAALMDDFFEKIASACRQWRTDGMCHGDEASERDFSLQLYTYLERKEKRYEIIQMPEMTPTGLAIKNPYLHRSKKLDFLSQLVREHLHKKTLILFQLSEGRTPLLLDKIQHVDREADILQVPEIKALSYVVDDFNLAPWEPSEPVKREYGEENA